MDFGVQWRKVANSYWCKHTTSTVRFGFNANVIHSRPDSNSHHRLYWSESPSSMKSHHLFLSWAAGKDQREAMKRGIQHMTQSYNSSSLSERTPYGASVSEPAICNEIRCGTAGHLTWHPEVMLTLSPLLDLKIFGFSESSGECVWMLMSQWLSFCVWIYCYSKIQIHTYTVNDEHAARRFLDFINFGFFWVVWLYEKHI